MGLLHPKLLLLLSHLAFLLFTSHSYSLPVPAPLPHPPAQPPSYHHKPPHHHHHHHPPPPTYPPKSPVHPPVKPPTKPPISPPVKPPVYPPVQPPVKPPTPPPVKPPVKPPTKPPTYPPVKPPTKPPIPPVKPPTMPPTPPVKPPTKPPTPPVKPPVPPPTPYHPLPRKPVAIQGVVYCKNCTYFGIDTLLGARPLAGATVVLKCKNTVYVAEATATTDKNGYFFMKAPKTVTSYGARRCRVYLASAPRDAPCRHPTNLNGGATGALLMPEKAPENVPYALFSVGPFAFEPPKFICRKH